MVGHSLGSVGPRSDAEDVLVWSCWVACLLCLAWNELYSMFISWGFLVLGFPCCVGTGTEGVLLHPPTIAVMLEMRLDRSCWPPGLGSSVGFGSPGGLGSRGACLASTGGERADLKRSMAEVPPSSCLMRLVRLASPPVCPPACSWVASRRASTACCGGSGGVAGSCWDIWGPRPESREDWDMMDLRLCTKQGFCLDRACS